MNQEISQSPASSPIRYGKQRVSGRINGGRSPQVIVMASGQTGIGRTSVSTALAEVMGSQEIKVLLITENSKFEPNFVDAVLLNEESVDWLVDLKSYFKKYDVVLYDCSDQISSDSLRIMMGAHTLVMVAMDDKDTIFRTYNFLKAVGGKLGIRHFKLVVNQANSAERAFALYHKLSSVVDKFLGISIDYLGFVPYDHQGLKNNALVNKTAGDFPTSLMSLCLNNLSRELAKPLFENDRIILR